MSKLVVFLHLTLDGVMQAPARPDEDTRGGFTHGGWAAIDEIGAIIAASDGFGSTGSFLFGRRTYEDLFAVWANATDNPFTDVFNESPKYVASTTLREPLPWRTSMLLSGDTARAVARLKQQASNDILILGSGALIRSLMPYDVIDEYILTIHPLVLGTGQRLFADGVPATSLELIDSMTTPSGIIMTTYRAKQPVSDRSPGT